MITAAIARHLDLVDDDLLYRPTSTGGNLFVGEMPSTPDAVLALNVYGSNSTAGGNALHGYGEPTIQIAARGAKADVRSPHDLIRRAFSHLIGLTSTVIAEGTPDEVEVCLIYGVQDEPFQLPGTDQNGRHTWAWNFAVHHRSLTANRL